MSLGFGRRYENPRARGLSQLIQLSLVLAVLLVTSDVNRFSCRYIDIAWQAFLTVKCQLHVEGLESIMGFSKSQQRDPTCSDTEASHKWPA